MELRNVEVHNFFQTICNMIWTISLTVAHLQNPWFYFATKCTTNNHTANFQSYSMILIRILSLVVFWV